MSWYVRLRIGYSIVKGIGGGGGGVINKYCKILVTLRNITLLCVTKRNTMEDKFKKDTNCKYCGQEMEAKYRSKKFCSNKCRVYFNREFKRGTINLPKVGEVIQNKMPVVDNTPFVVTEIKQHNHSLTLTVKPIKEEIPRLKGEDSISYRIRTSTLTKND